MKKIDIKNIELQLKIKDLIEAMNSCSLLAIDINGKIYTNEIDQKAVLIFKRNIVDISSSCDEKQMISQMFTKEYKPSFDEQFCTIKPLIAWQEVVKINEDRMLYLDHPNDGLEVFNDSYMEDIGFEAVVFDISYRDMAEFIETNCDGVFVFYENDIQFSGFVLVDDIEQTRIDLKKFVQDIINKKVKSGEIDLQDLDLDQEAAYEFIFKD